MAQSQTGKSTNAKPRRGYDQHPECWYVEPPWTTLALLRYERFDGLTLDPACGQGNVLQAFADRGIGPTVGADIRDRGWPGTILHDFADSPRVLEDIRWSSMVAQGLQVPPDRDAAAALQSSIKPLGLVSNVVSNPPYGGATLAVRFLEGALRLKAIRKVALFLPIRFLAAGCRHSLFQELPPARIYMFSDRPSCPPGHLLAAGEIEAKGGSVDYCWVVWIVGWGTPPTVRWLNRADAEAP